MTATPSRWCPCLAAPAGLANGSTGVDWAGCSHTARMRVRRRGGRAYGRALRRHPAARRPATSRSVASGRPMLPAGSGNDPQS